jgi:hypothetical protein
MVLKGGVERLRVPMEAERLTKAMMREAERLTKAMMREAERLTKAMMVGHAKGEMPSVDLPDLPGIRLGLALRGGVRHPPRTHANREQGREPETHQYALYLLPSHVILSFSWRCSGSTAPEGESYRRAPIIKDHGSDSHPRSCR